MLPAILIFQVFWVKNTRLTDNIARMLKDTVHIASFSMIKYLQSAAVKLGNES